MSEQKTKPKTIVPTVEQLFKARAHLGHQTRRWSPLMEPYIFSKVKKTHIIDLEKTHKHLKVAVNFLKKIKAERGTIIFVGTKRQAKELVEKYAKETKSFYVRERWVGGILTNWDNTFANLKDIKEVGEGLKSGKYDDFTKKERLLLSRRVTRNTRLLGGLADMSRLPDALIIVDPRRENVALREAQKMKIPVVAIVDTNTDPTGIDYVIPANDDAIGSLDLILGTLALSLA